MNVFRRAARLVACLPLLSVACMLDRSATATDCSEGVPCRLQQVGDNTPTDPADAAVEPNGAYDAGDAGDADAAEPAQNDAQISVEDAGWPEGGGDAASIEPSPGDAALQRDASPVDAAVIDPAAAPSNLPRPTRSCPEFSEGSVRFAGNMVRLWVGSDGESKRGPLVFYWYSSGSSSAEALIGLGADAIAEVKQLGGVVAAVEETNGGGTSTGSSSWYTGDYAVADEVLACAIAKGVGIDTTRIHSVGFGAGGMQSSWMAYARSNYLASIVSYSGGLTSSWRTNSVTADASNVVPAMLVHGKSGVDRYVYDYALTSAAMASDIADKGGFALDCEHSLGHAIPDGIGAPALRFLLDHPYKKTPSPYRVALPSIIPSYCKLP